MAQSLAAPPVPPQLVSSTAGTTAMSSTAAGSSTAVEAGSIAQADEAEVIKIDDEEEELQPKTSMDAMLAQQLASELERGSYAQVLAWSGIGLRYHCISIGMLAPAGFSCVVHGCRTC